MPVTAKAQHHEVEKIPATMRAAVYHGKNDVRVESVPVPQIGPGEILVRVHTCGICGTDLKKISTGSHSARASLDTRSPAKSPPSTPA